MHTLFSLYNTHSGVMYLGVTSDFNKTCSKLTDDILRKNSAYKWLTEDYRRNKEAFVWNRIDGLTEAQAINNRRLILSTYPKERFYNNFRDKIPSHCQYQKRKYTFKETVRDPSLRRYLQDNLPISKKELSMLAFKRRIPLETVEKTLNDLITSGLVVFSSNSYRFNTTHLLKGAEGVEDIIKENLLDRLVLQLLPANHSELIKRFHEFGLARTDLDKTIHTLVGSNLVYKKNYVYFPWRFKDNDPLEPLFSRLIFADKQAKRKKRGEKNSSFRESIKQNVERIKTKGAEKANKDSIQLAAFLQSFQN